MFVVSLEAVTDAGNYSSTLEKMLGILVNFKLLKNVLLSIVLGKPFVEGCFQNSAAELPVTLLWILLYRTSGALVKIARSSLQAF